MRLNSWLYGRVLIVALGAILVLGPNSLLVHTALSSGNDPGSVALIGVQKGLLRHLAAAVFEFSPLPKFRPFRHFRPSRLFRHFRPFRLFRLFQHFRLFRIFGLFGFFEFFHFPDFVNLF